MKSFKELTSLLTILLVSSASLFAFQKETRDLDTFNEISLRTSSNIYLTQGNTQKVEISGDDLGRLETRVRDGKLIIDHRDKNSWNNWSRLGKIDIHITVKDIKALAVSGSGDIAGKGKFNVNDLDISVAGSGNLEFDADAKDVDISIAGSGSVILTGNSRNNHVSISGSGKLDAEDMITEIYRISISGSGRCKVHVKEEIKSKISGSGSVYYKGDPKRINNNSSGSGKARKI